MRTVFVGIFVCITISICQAQSQPQAQPSDTPHPALQLNPSTPQREFKVDQLPLLGDEWSQKKRTLPLKLSPEGSDNPGPCYTMRAYMFSPGTEGTAPRPIGYTTCVSSRTLQLRQTKPRLKLLPQ